MNQREGDQKDETCGRARRADIGDRNDNDGNENGREQDRGRRRPASRTDPGKEMGQRSVVRHDQRDPGCGIQIRIQRGKHGEESGDDNEPESRSAEEILRRNCDHGLGMTGTHLYDRRSNRHAHRGNDEEEGQIDDKSDPKGEEHGPW